MPAAGRRNRLILIERATPVLDAHGGENASWAVLCRAWCEVRFGSSEERRRAAQEHASQSALFALATTPRLRLVTPLDRIRFMDAVWDISGVSIEGDGADMVIAATRAA
jgi:head-tail adaptor